MKVSLKLDADDQENDRSVMIYWKQFKSLVFHKWHVLKAGLMIGNIPLWRLIIHDWSKFTPVEFVNYARFKYGRKDTAGWARAWLHHLHHNPHHPEHWILSWRGNPDFYNSIGKGIAPFITMLSMPETYAREMVADMMATSKEVTGSYDIAVWLNENGPKMRLHDGTIARLGKAMVDAGYYFTDNSPWSYMAGNKFKWWNLEVK
ncbi:hypothetical protein LCGC14_1376350 [marine sediment metagenome]|uniref:Uncharacterized protein n=1 Tax=marine sediment metagenome TaxID=412755 RepID=A0A0F9K418_9ZZZZ